MFFQWKRISKYENAHQIRMKRTEALEIPLRKKLIGERLEIFTNEKILDCLIDLTNFQLNENVRQWILNNCKDKEEILYVFQLFFQRALNTGRDYFSMEDFNIIKENIDFAVLHKHNHNSIGTTYTLGRIEGKLQKVIIKCCAVPTKEGKGNMVCSEQLSIEYLFAKRMIKNYNIYVEISPSKPKEDNLWEAALIVAIYSAIYNKILPFRSIILGGIDKKGNIMPIKEDRLEKVLQEDFSYIVTGYWKYKNYDLQRCKPYNMIYVHTLEEVFSKMQGISKNAKDQKFKDFLCL